MFGIFLRFIKMMHKHNIVSAKIWQTRRSGVCAGHDGREPWAHAPAVENSGHEDRTAKSSSLAPGGARLLTN